MKIKFSTFSKYLFTYILLYGVFVIVSWTSFRSEMINKLVESQIENSMIKLNATGEQLSSEMNFLTQVNGTINKNKIIFKYCHGLDEVSYDTVKEELKKYDLASSLINSIVLKADDIDHPVSTVYPITWENNTFVINVDSSYEENIIFDPSPYIGCNHEQIICISGKTKNFLIYFPRTEKESKKILFYFLDLNEMSFTLKMFLSNQVAASALVNSEGFLVKGENEKLLMQYQPFDELTEGQFSIDERYIACVSEEIMRDHRLLILVDREVIAREVEAILGNFYIKMIPLIVLIIVLIHFSMRLTYSPLRRITQQLSANKCGIADRHLEQLEDMFYDMSRTNEELSEKLNNYKSKIQESLFEKLLEIDDDKIADIPDIDVMFENSGNQQIFLVYLVVPVDSLLIERFQESVEASCLRLKQEGDKVLFMVWYTGESDKADQLKRFLQSFCENNGCRCAVSKCAGSPLDIPMLYENVTLASEQLPQVLVADGGLTDIQDKYVFPYDQLDELQNAMKGFDYHNSRNVVNEMLEQINNTRYLHSHFDDYYVQNFLLNILWAVVNVLNEINVDFRDYKDVYYELLFNIRSRDYYENRVLIEEEFGELLDIFEQKSCYMIKKTTPIRVVVEECYCQPEFSIAILAERFQVSVSYMSYQFKKEFGMTFSDYLWKMRFEKAKELLLMTNKTVDEVSNMVGYYSRTSFIKKFKQETNMTPTEFRQNSK